jgi:hypothetical protein
MPENSIKVGDRVKVEFEGTVTQVHGDGEVTVNRNVEGDTYSNWLPASECTVIAAPLKVGDRVTTVNCDYLPDGAVLSAGETDVLIVQEGRGYSANDGRGSETRFCIDYTIVYLP